MLEYTMNSRCRFATANTEGFLGAKLGHAHLFQRLTSTRVEALECSFERLALIGQLQCNYL